MEIEDAAEAYIRHMKAANGELRACLASLDRAKEQIRKAERLQPKGDRELWDWVVDHLEDAAAVSSVDALDEKREALELGRIPTDERADRLLAKTLRDLPDED